MCLLALEYQTVPAAPILVLANREEAYSRPGTPPQRNSGPKGMPDWVGGIDPVAGGTWLGVNARGVLVAVTNRRKASLPPNPRSRGLLCRDLLGASSAQVARDMAVSALSGSGTTGASQPAYAGCNFLLADSQSAWVVEAGDQFRVTALPPGLHLITNGDLNNDADMRIDRVRRELAASRPESLAEWRLRGEQICSARATGLEPAICLEGTDGGTISSSIIACGGDLADVMYFHAAGPPSHTPFLEYSPLLRTLLSESDEQATSPPHRIQLRGPWEFELFDQNRQRKSTGKLRLPLTEFDPFNGHRGFVRWKRRFHRPTNLGSQDRVFLAFAGVNSPGVVKLNGQPLGTIAASPAIQILDVTGQLIGEEDLVIEFEVPESAVAGQSAGTFFSVTVEIHAAK